MDAILQIVLSVLGGLSTVAGVILFYKSNKRIKDAEATKAEIEALRQTIEALREENRSIREKYEAIERRLSEKDSLSSKLYRIIEDKEESIHKLRKAIANGHSCSKNASDCPIRRALTELGVD